MEYKIETGNSKRLKLGFLSYMEVVYGGMPNDNTFVLSPFKPHATYRGYSPSIFYHIKSTQIKLMNLDIQVRQVTTDYIIIEI